MWLRALSVLTAATAWPICILIIAADACGQDRTARDVQSIIADGRLRVAMTRFDLPSFHHRRADGSIGGPEATLARQMARALNVEVSFVDDNQSFDGVVGAVAAGRADIGISKLSKTYYRLVQVRFSDPYITLRHALLYDRAKLANQSGGRAPADVLRGFQGRIGVIAGSAYVDFARRNFPNSQVSELRDWSEVVSSLQSGRVDAIYRDEFEIRSVLQRNPALNVQFGAGIIVDQFARLSVAICGSCARLQEFINFHLQETRGTFTLKGLLNDAERE